MREKGNVQLSYTVSIRWSHLGEEMQVIPHQALGGREPGYLCQEREETAYKVEMGSKGFLLSNGNSNVNIPFSGVASACYLNLKYFLLHNLVNVLAFKMCLHRM